MYTVRGLLRHREYVVVLGGFAGTALASTLTAVALAVLVFERTGSPLLSGLALASGSLPYLVGAVFLLAYADRLPPRRALAAIGALQAAAIAVLATGRLAPAAMLVVMLALGAVLPVGTAARSGLLPDLLPEDAYVLGRAVYNMTGYVTQLAGYAAGGLVLTAAGPGTALWVAAALAAGAGLTSTALRPRPARGGSDGTDGSDGAVWRQTWRTNRRLLADPAVRGLLLAHWLPMAAASGAEGAFVPYAAAHGPAALASALFWAGAAGMLAGDLVFGRFLTPERQDRCTLAAAVLLGVPLLLFAVGPPVLAAAGLCFAAFLGMSYHLGLQRRFLAAVPVEARGQGFGLLLTGIVTTQGATLVAGGALAEVWPPGVVVAVFGAAVLAGVAVLRRQLRP
ncbi:MFS transporter [Dactylosporangium sp. AC04546]|uniref:MFS transporter n=1 Tax=Dactylosporangium sp. AC04546 TaxID=2862460 RepID=UPI001EDF3EC9|nr:MFS transporter [Dactylosporangium sp. AC04546]WVK78407.1 MFS transporter [Dactylosporangium sp. AC04546]